MERVTIVLCLLALSLSNSQADQAVANYINLKKNDINAFHQFFPSRTLEGERLTTLAAVGAINSLTSYLNDSLYPIVSYQKKELVTAKQLFAGTDAVGCVEGIANFIDKSIENAIENFIDCTAYAQSQFTHLNNTWAKVQTNYEAAYQRAESGMDVCAQTYPNKNSIARLKSCVDSMNNNYFVAANTAQSSVSPSPSMTYFQQAVVGCASDAATSIAASGWQFLGMLVDCSQLSEGAVDPKSYADQLNQWGGYNDTLAQQILSGQVNNQQTVEQFEAAALNYYNMQKQTLEQYVFQSRGFSFYLNQAYTHLSDYYNTVTATSLDNPGDSFCADTAKVALDAVANKTATDSLLCDQQIVNITTQMLSDVLNNFMAVNTKLPYVGNTAILNCFSQGYVYAPNTIKDCYDLNSAGFNIEESDRQNSIIGDVAVIQNYINTFFNNSNLPCGGTSLAKLLLAAETALYELKRCLYKSSGDTYSVTTPIPYTTTTPALTSSTFAPS